jgi:hypothetical protein
MEYVKGMAVETGDHTAQTKKTAGRITPNNRPMFFHRHLKMPVEQKKDRTKPTRRKSGRVS